MQGETSSDAGVEDSYPLSPMQQGMLFNTLLDPGSGVDVEQLVYELHEPLEVATLRRAWQRLADRHPVLRTNFRWENLDRPRQEVRARVESPWEEHDWSAVSGEERQRLLGGFLGADRRRGFELDRAPFFRVTLLRYGDAHFLLIWTVHHAVLDGWSFGLALREVFAFYEAFRVGKDQSLPLPRPYREYVNWLERQDPGGGEAFWTEKLKGFYTPTPLTIDHPPVALVDDLPRKETREVSLSAQTTARLRALAEENHFALSTIVHGAWAFLLSSYSGERDVVFGAIRANRRSAIEGAESMMGLFVNTLPLRARVDADAELIPWLRELRAQWLAIGAHEQTALARVLALSEVPSDTQLFQSTVVYEHRDLDTILREQGGAWSRRRLRQYSQTNFPLDVAAWGGAEMRLTIDFDRSRIDADAAGRMLGHLRNLLEDMAHHPRRRLGELTLLSSEERHQILVEWNRTAVDPLPVACLHKLFERQATRAPDAIAVQYEDACLTFGELNRRANRLVRNLRGMGVHGGVLVGVFAERSLETIVAMLAILKAGGAYVPLSPRHPPERIAAIVADSRLPVLLVQEKLIPSLPALRGTTIASLDGPERAPGADAADDVPGDADVQGLAYVIYTSGTTGHPKGVMVPHAAICNHLRWMQRAFPLGASDAVLQKTALDFDVSVWEIFAPLTTGAKLVLLRSGTDFDPQQIVASIRAQGVTAIQLTPVQLNLLLDEPAFQHCAPPLKHVFCGGEVLAPQTCRLFCSTLPCVTLSNMYGPTEASIDATYWNCPADGNVDVVPIGRPIDNARCYVVGPSMQLLPPGIPGELVIGGQGLARGYLDNPRLTAEKFVPDPFAAKPAERVYKTGDRVRLMADGNIEYLGRIDRQVKVRGLRIELEEIEGAVARHPRVQACCVATREDVPGDQRLVAYFVPRMGAAPNVRELQEFLRRSLPEYMIPGQFVNLHKLPLRPSGKVDYGRLPAPASAHPGDRAHVLPRTPTEVRLANIWSEILRTREFGVEDNLVDLGANSLMLIQLVREINLQLDVKFAIPEIVQNPTVERLAALVDNARSVPRQRSRVVPFQKGGNGLPVYFIFAGLPEYRIAKRMGSSRHDVYGVEVRWPLAWRDALATDTKSDDPDMEEVVAPYVEALHSHVGSTPCAIVGLSFAGLMAFEAAHQLQERGGTVEVLVVVVDVAARPSSPYKLAWKLLRKAWTGQGADGRNNPVRQSIRPRLRNSWETSLWILSKAASRARSSIVRAAPNLDVLTHIFDEEHRPIPWALVERFYTYAHGTYRPRAIDCRGLLIRTDGTNTISLGDSLGWSNLFKRGLGIISIGGEHDSIFDYNIPKLAGEISKAVARNPTADDESARIVGQTQRGSGVGH